MFTFFRPSEADLHDRLTDHPGRWACAPFGNLIDADRLPWGYRRDAVRQRVDTGVENFDRAVRAIRDWAIFPKSLAEPFPQPLSIEVGQTVVLRLHAFGIWAVGPCRIIEVIDETAPRRRFGFVYAALAGHLARGEERFLVELVPEDNSVWYEIVAVSRPRAWWAWAGYPLLRAAQKRFRRLSIEAIRCAIHKKQPCPY
jgi:uncharacterized protein (UPF0548 family)